MTTPPVAKKVPKIDTLHGEIRQDDYYWLREKDDPEVLAYLRAENGYTDGVMKPQESFQESLYQEMLARIKEDDSSVPYRRGAYFYYSRTERGKQYPIYCRKAGSLDAPEEVMLDLNVLAEGHPFFSLGSSAISPAFASTRCTSRTCARASFCRAPSSAWPPSPGPPTT